MQLKTVTAAKDIPFGGIELVKTDKKITEVIIAGKVRISRGDYSNQLNVFVEVPYEEAKRHRVTATIDGFDPKIMHFENSWDASQAERDFRDKGAEVETAEITVLLNDDGVVVGDAGYGPAPTSGPAPTPADDMVPF